ncbi:MAG TPA: ParB/RepB/Spo0J family partition protein [Candidatus Aquirickettsiella sp.]|jgi:ParB family chromosome partitioning protein
MRFPAFDAINLKQSIDTLLVDNLRLEHIVPDENQPRKKFHEDLLQELASSIKQYGVIQPILVRQIGIEKYQIIAGERRWRASQLAELEMIPAIVKTDKIKDDVAISLIENIQRKELNPVELAEAFYQLNNIHGLSHESIGIMVGKSRATITNFLRLLNLSTEIRNLLIDGKLEMGHARSLLTLPLEQQSIFAYKIIEKNLTVRDAEKIVQVFKAPLKKNKLYDTEISVWVGKLSDIFSSKVTININEKGKGILAIHFSSPEEIDRLIDKLVTETKNMVSCN